MPNPYEAPRAQLRDSERVLSVLERRTLMFYARYRDSNPTFLDVVRFNWAIFAFWLVAIPFVFVIVLALLGSEWAYAASAAIVGAALRELRRAHATSRIWPLTRSIVDWDKVQERLACVSVGSA